MSEMPECIIYRKPVARKSHRCCECRGCIQKGEVYQRVSGIWDGEPMRFKTCIDCATLRDKIQPKDHWDCVYFEGLREWLTEGDETELLLEFQAIKQRRCNEVPKVQ